MLPDSKAAIAFVVKALVAMVKAELEGLTGRPLNYLDQLTAPSWGCTVGRPYR